MGQLFWIVVAAIGIGLILVFVNESGGTATLVGDDYGRLAYLGIWGGVVAAGILGSGMRLGYIARSLGLWAAIILGFVAGYQYRYELQDIASRVTAGLIPGSPLTVSGSGDTVMLDKLGNGHFEARATINGKTIRVMVDTGATSTVLTAADARAAGYDPQALRYSVTVSTANGIAHAARVETAEIAIGSIRRRNLDVLVAEDRSLEQSLLGMNFLGTLSGYEVRGDRMILRD